MEAHFFRVTVSSHHLKCSIRPMNHAFPILLQLLWIFPPIPPFFLGVPGIRIVGLTTQVL